MPALTSDGSLDLTADVVDLTQTICDVPSESGDESRLVDAIEEALRRLPHLTVTRFGNTLAARTELGRGQRVAIAGHVDTVPINDNLPTRYETRSPEQAAEDAPGTKPGEYLWGRGTVDMKAGVAAQLKLAAELTEPVVDVTWLWYDNEEVSAERNGLGKLAAAHPELFEADFAILGEPTNARVEGGCNGSIRAEVITRGRRAHSARWWTGENAVHAAGEILRRFDDYTPAEVPVEGLTFREGLSAVGIRGGVAGNVIPDECRVHVNYRFAPDKSLAQARAHLESVFDGFELEYLDLSPAARPGLDAPLAQAFLASVGGDAVPKMGWTDVARFSALGVPAVNYGPGDPQKAHADDERVLLAEIRAVEAGLRAWLTGASGTPAGASA
ncbi:succinyl-diaminopimelate desuccinylase [Gulosibacter faecalis]|uniref:Succinyl-diaminopimelate desuccinylase n=1 Tax=Gulosibacter faecalis TaxID=272240 RepID=A0ABW5UXF3_9MICO|nr:succinyl-diaminopimelate desuccinylase [Gulosibacter faecalis]